MKTKTHIFLLVPFMLFFSCSKKITSVVRDHSISVKINVTTENIEGARLSVAFESFEKIWSDTIINNKKNVEIRVPKEGFYWVSIEGRDPNRGKQFTYFFSSPIYLSDHCYYNIDYGDYENAAQNLAKIRSNSRIQKVLSKYYETYRRTDKGWRINLERKAKIADSLYHKNAMPEYAQAWDEYIRYMVSLRGLKSKYIANFALQNPKSIVSAYYINGLDNFQKHYATYLEIYNQFSAEMKETSYLKEFLNRLKAVEPMIDGKPFPAISGQGIAGDNYQSSFERYPLTLVNFWSPSERVSREEMGELKPIYSTYHDKGFNIISVAFTRDTTLWKEAIKQDGFIWPEQYSDVKVIQESQNGKRLDVEIVPQNYLIDDKGKIITKNIKIDSLVLLLKKMK